MTRAACYLRVSTEGQAEKGYSLKEQRASLLAYCEANRLTVIEVVEDAGLSGTDTNRAGILRLEELMAARVIDVVVCAKIDRLSRLAWFGERFIADAQSRGVSVVFTDQRFDASPVGDFTRHVMAGVAQLDHAQIVERMLGGKLQKAKERGVMPVGQPPFGYTMISRAQATALPEYAGRDGEMLINEAEAAIVREVFRRFVGGESLGPICRWLLDESGAPGHWDYARTKRLLRQEAYKGERHYGKTRWKKGLEIGPKPREEWITFPCPALVSVEDWDTVQRLLEAASISGRPSTDYILRGMVFCGVCKGLQGKPIRCCGYRPSHRMRAAGYGQRFYRCNSKNMLLLDTCSVNVRASELEPGLLKFARRSLRPGEMAKLAAKRAEAELRQSGNVEAEVSNLTVQLQQLDREEQRVMDVAIEGFSPTVIRDRLASITARRSTLERLLETAKARLTRRQDLMLTAARAEVMAAEALRLLNEAEAKGDRQAMNEVLVRLFRVTLLPDRAPKFEVIVPGITN